MAWKITNRTPVKAEGDRGVTAMTFDVEWDGTISRILEKVVLDLEIKDITTDIEDDVRFEDSGGILHELVLEPDGKKGLSGSFTVLFNGDEDEEDYEIFAVEAANAYWFERDPASGALDTKPPAIPVHRSAIGVIANDDPKTESVDLEYAAGVVRDLAEDGKIDKTTRDGLLGEIEAMGGGTGKPPKKGDAKDDADQDDEKSGEKPEQEGDTGAGNFNKSDKIIDLNGLLGQDAFEFPDDAPGGRMETDLLEDDVIFPDFRVAGKPGERGAGESATVPPEPALDILQIGSGPLAGGQDDFLFGTG